jgi:hypothetical protein
VPFRLAVAFLVCAALRSQPPAAHTVRFADLPPGIARRFDPASFDARIQEIERDTSRREREGEFEHLVYYALQSQRFTSLPRIEPALSAREFFEKSALPGAVQARLASFLKAIGRPSRDPRLGYFAGLLAPGQRSVEFLEGEYRRVMRFLYDKEFLRREHAYETRGHSTDTQVEANYAVWTGLSVLKELRSASAIRRVLIVGPGLDMAPRTALVDSHPPQSFQPYAVADALLGLGLSKPGQLNIDCADISARVVEFIDRFPFGTRRLELYSGPGDGEYERYFKALGGAAGKRSGGNLEVNVDVARAVRAERLNVLTSRWEAQYDLAIATNVLVYFNRRELSLALANISSMIRPGGYFLHNDGRPEIDVLAAASGLEALQARTVRVNTQMFDAFAIYRKAAYQ